MLKISGMVTGFADALGLERKTVNMFARALRGAGRLSTYGRAGAASPPMSARDGARLLVALLSTSRPSAAVESSDWFGGLATLHQGNYRNRGRLARFVGDDREVTFERAITALIEVFSRDGVMHAEIRVREYAGFATLFMGDEEYRFYPVDPAIHEAGGPIYDRMIEGANRGLGVERFVNRDGVLRIGKLFSNQLTRGVDSL